MTTTKNIKRKWLYSTKFLIFMSTIIIIVAIWFSLEYNEDNYYEGNSFNKNDFEFRSAQFISARHISSRFQNVYPQITPFFSDEIDYFYGHQKPSKAYIKLYYMLNNWFYNPKITINTFKKNLEDDQIVQYRLIGTQELNGKEYKFDEKINFNRNGKIIAISDETEN